MPAVVKLLGSGEHKTLIFASDENYVQNESVQIVCREGFIEDLRNWR